MKIAVPKVQGKPFADALITGVVKVAEEKLVAMTPVGNGNLMSGGAKLIGSAMIPNGKYSKYLKDAMGIDAVEDISKVVFDFVAGKVNGSTKQAKSNTI